MACIIETDDGKYQVRWELGKGKDGSRRRGSRTFYTKTEAENFRCFVDPSSHRAVVSTDFEAGMRAWIDWRQDAGFINAKTAERQLNIAENFGRVLGKKINILNITVKEITGAHKSLMQGGGASGRPLKPLTLRQHMSVGKKFFEFLHKAGMIPANPFVATELPPAPVERVSAPEETMVGKLLDLAKTSCSCLCQLWLLILLVSQTGLRRGEALALRWSDLDIVEHSLRIERSLMQTRQGLFFKKPKTAAGFRDVDIAPWLMRLLLAHREKQRTHYLMAGVEGSDLMFADELGDPLRPDRVSCAVADLKRRAGWSSATKGIHGLRHAFATALCKTNLPIVDVATALGHADPSFTLRTYVHRPKNVVRTAGVMQAPKGFGLSAH